MPRIAAYRTEFVRLALSCHEIATVPTHQILFTFFLCLPALPLSVSLSLPLLLLCILSSQPVKAKAIANPLHDERSIKDQSTRYASILKPCSQSRKAFNRCYPSTHCFVFIPAAPMRQMNRRALYTSRKIISVCLCFSSRVSKFILYHISSLPPF